MRTGTEYRYHGKKRAEKFRKNQEKKGYKSITIFASKELREELKRLKIESGMNKQTAIQHIFETYINTKNNATNIKKNNTQTTNNEPGSPQHLKELDNFILERHKKGGKGGTMSLKEIAEALNKAEIKSTTGKNKWKPGNVDTAFKAAAKRQK